MKHFGPSAMRSVTVPPPLLEADNVSVLYQSNRGPVPALRGLNLSIQEGDFVSILGPSGCGKSTLLNLIIGLISTSSGSVKVKGTQVSGPRPDVGVVFQQPTLLPWATVIENVLIPIRALGRPVRSSVDRAREILTLVGLERFANHYPNELSGGMQQRVGIARALIHDPDLLLMDEPFAALDAMTRERMAVELQDIWIRTRKTVLLITHSISEAVFSSDRVLMMSGSPGRIVRELSIDLPRPRTLEIMSTLAFGALCGELRQGFNDHARAHS
jgi:NitT/TauT family transport system ATP-binding protein